MQTRWKAILLLAATFAGGALAGGAVVAFADRGDEQRRNHEQHGGKGHVEFMSRELDLTREQRDSVQAILGRYRPRMDSIWRQIGPRFETIRDSISNDIRRQLTPDQQSRYDRMLERFQREREERERGKD